MTQWCMQFDGVPKYGKHGDSAYDRALDTDNSPFKEIGGFLLILSYNLPDKQISPAICQNH